MNRSDRRVGARSPWAVSITYCDGSCGPGLAAVGRAPAASTCNVCFLGIRVVASARAEHLARRAGHI